MLQPATMCFRVRGVRTPLAEGAASPAEGIEVDTEWLAKQAGDLPLAALEQWRRFRWEIEHPLVGTRTPTTNRIRAMMRRAYEEGEVSKSGGPWFAGLDESEVWVNATEQFIDSTDVRSLTEGEMAGRRQARELLGYWRRHVPGFESSELLMTAQQLGIRESRRIVGEHVLSGDDIIERRPVHDPIAMGCWPIDVHLRPGETPTPEEQRFRGFKPRPPYPIPYRCLVPLEIDQLLVAGRCISSTREGMGSIRVMGTCMALGEAAGTAAALAASAHVRPRDLDTATLCRTLRNQGAIIEWTGHKIGS